MSSSSSHPHPIILNNTLKDHEIVEQLAHQSEPSVLASQDQSAVTLQAALGGMLHNRTTADNMVWEADDHHDHHHDQLHDHDQLMIPKTLILFDPPPQPQYPCPIFLSHHAHGDDQQQDDELSTNQVPSGVLRAGDHDHEMVMEDSITSRHLMTNGHDHHHHRNRQYVPRSTPTGLNSTSSNQMRTCVDCNTTKTPLWRSGPLGPKSLCNACGIRHHKARRARAAAAAAAGGEMTSGNSFVSAAAKVKKDKKSNTKPNSTLPFKKRSKMFTTPRRMNRICFEVNLNSEVEDDDALHYSSDKKTLELPMDLSNSTKSFKRVFPEDEEQAAILLMALSCGLVHG